MKARPWPIVILALLHILAPFANVIFCAELSHQSVWEFTRSIALTDGVWGIVDFFLLLPIAGVALYMCKPWSYPIFLAITLQTIWVNYQTWQSAPAIFTFPMLTVTGFLDIAFVAYFMLPSVRKTYMDASVRWWEAKPRYPVQIDGETSAERGGSADCRIVDLSEGGAFIQSSASYESESPVQLRFVVLGQKFEVPCRVVYRRTVEPSGYGLRFEPTSRREGAKLRRLAHAMFLLGIRPRHQHNWQESLLEWTKGLVTEGKGLFPDANNGRGQKKPSNVISIGEAAATKKKRSDSDAA